MCGCVLFKSAEKKSPFSIISVHTWRRGRTFNPNFYGVLDSQASFQRYVGWISLQNFVTVLYGNFPRFSPNSRAKTESVLLKASKRNDSLLKIVPQCNSIKHRPSLTLDHNTSLAFSSPHLYSPTFSLDTRQCRKFPFNQSGQNITNQKNGTNH